MKLNHEIDLKEVADYEPAVTLASSSSRHGSKRLTMFVRVGTKAVRYEVNHREGDLSRHETLEAAVAAYNAIAC